MCSAVAMLGVRACLLAGVRCGGGSGVGFKMYVTALAVSACKLLPSAVVCSSMRGWQRTASTPWNLLMLPVSLQAYSSGSSSGVLTMARLDGAGNAPTADTLEQQLREAFLELQLAAAAAEGAAWAGLDLAGLPRAAGVQQLAQYRQE